jgi:hypothetical protein
MIEEVLPSCMLRLDKHGSSRKQQGFFPSIKTQIKMYSSFIKYGVHLQYQSYVPSAVMLSVKNITRY